VFGDAEDVFDGVFLAGVVHEEPVEESERLPVVGLEDAEVEVFHFQPLRREIQFDPSIVVADAPRLLRVGFVELELDRPKQRDFRAVPDGALVPRALVFDKVVRKVRPYHPPFRVERCEVRPLPPEPARVVRLMHVDECDVPRRVQPYALPADLQLSLRRAHHLVRIHRARVAERQADYERLHFREVFQRAEPPGQSRDSFRRGYIRPYLVPPLVYVVFIFELVSGEFRA